MPSVTDLPPPAVDEIVNPPAVVDFSNRHPVAFEVAMQGIEHGLSRASTVPPPAAVTAPASRTVAPVITRMGPDDAALAGALVRGSRTSTPPVHRAVQALGTALRNGGPDGTQAPGGCSPMQ